MHFPVAPFIEAVGRFISPVVADRIPAALAALYDAGTDTLDEADAARLISAAMFDGSPMMHQAALEALPFRLAQIDGADTSVILGARDARRHPLVGAAANGTFDALLALPIRSGSQMLRLAGAPVYLTADTIEVDGAIRVAYFDYQFSNGALVTLQFGDNQTSGLVTRRSLSGEALFLIGDAIRANFPVEPMTIDEFLAAPLPAAPPPAPNSSNYWATMFGGQG